MKLEICNVTKTYGDVKALDNFSVTFEPGVYGILGANGAGKSTLINLITDNISRDSGEAGGRILYDGEDILKLNKRFRTKVGYMPQQQGLYEDMTAESFLRYMADLKEIKRKEAVKQIDKLLDIVNLKAFRHKKISGFSGGMKQRIALAQALLGNPEILIMDEPTAGLDPKERINIRNYISELSKDKIILFCTHVVSDIECIADKVLIIKKGKLIAVDTPEKLIQRIEGKVSEIICDNDAVKELQKSYKVGNVRQVRDGVKIRLIGDKLTEGQVAAEDIGLEDVYLYYLE